MELSNSIVSTLDAIFLGRRAIKAMGNSLEISSELVAKVANSGWGTSIALPLAWTYFLKNGPPELNAIVKPAVFSDESFDSKSSHEASNVVACEATALGDLFESHASIIAIFHNIINIKKCLIFTVFPNLQWSLGFFPN